MRSSRTNLSRRVATRGALQHGKRSGSRAAARTVPGNRQDRRRRRCRRRCLRRWRSGVLQEAPPRRSFQVEGIGRERQDRDPTRASGRRRPLLLCERTDRRLSFKLVAASPNTRLLQGCLDTWSGHALKLGSRGWTLSLFFRYVPVLSLLPPPLAASAIGCWLVVHSNTIV